MPADLFSHTWLWGSHILGCGVRDLDQWGLQALVIGVVLVDGTCGLKLESRELCH